MTILFIVGAGASVEFGFPTGPALQQKIASFLTRKRGDYDFDRRLEDVIPVLMTRHGVSYSEFLETAKWMSTALPLSPSIDSFLETHSSGSDLIGELGKFSIATLIGQAEKNSSLFQDPRNSPVFDGISDSWLGQMWKRGISGVKNSNPDAALSNFRFVTFNYDRCIEQFILLSYCHYFRCTISDAFRFLETRPVEHVYGSLGSIQGHSSQYGHVLSGEQILSLIGGFKTYSEQVDTDTADRISEVVSSSSMLVFLGFSFARINRDFLNASMKKEGPVKKVYGTSMGMSDSDARLATSWANARFRRGSTGGSLTDSSAAEFFSKNGLIF